MKILYAVQATGNGHISRAMELLPSLQQYGNVDIFLSGANSNLALDAPIKFRSKGLSLFYNCTGGLDYWQMVKGFHPFKLKKEINDLPVENYDLIINDFEYITAAACAKKHIPSINFGHQASFQSNNTPRPTKKNIAGEWVLKNYAKASAYVGLHFSEYADFIFKPIIKQEILLANPIDQNYITVYLPSYCEPQLLSIFQQFKKHRFEIFCSSITQSKLIGNILFLPIDKKLFNKSLINCTGIITGGGFETPAEALQLGKKIMSIPIKGQYEQQCNAAALKQMGVYCIDDALTNFNQHFEKWLATAALPSFDFSNSMEQSVDYLFKLHDKLKVNDYESSVAV